MSQALPVALFTAYVCMAKALHKQGALPLADLVNELGNTIDSQRMTGTQDADLEFLKMIYQGIQAAEGHQLQIEALQAQIAALQSRLASGKPSDPSDA
jgi:hypothetical protein